MEQGLPKTQQDQDLAKAWIKAQIEEARVLAMGEWKMPKPAEGMQHTDADVKNAKDALINKNKFYDVVKNVVDHTADKSLAADSLIPKQLKIIEDTAFEKMKQGESPKGFGEILSDAMGGFGETLKQSMPQFDMWHPMEYIGQVPGAIIGAIMSVISQAIGNTAISYFSDSTAGTMKALKHNYLDNAWERVTGNLPKDFKPMTTEEAERNLQFQNAGKALGEYLGVNKAQGAQGDQQIVDFGQAVASQLDAKPTLRPSAGNVAATVASGAPKQDVIVHGGNIASDGSLKTTLLVELPNKQGSSDYVLLEANPVGDKKSYELQSFFSDNAGKKQDLPKALKLVASGLSFPTVDGREMEGLSVRELQQKLNGRAQEIRDAVGEKGLLRDGDEKGNVVRIRLKEIETLVPAGIKEKVSGIRGGETPAPADPASGMVVPAQPIPGANPTSKLTLHP